MISLFSLDWSLFYRLFKFSCKQLISPGKQNTFTVLLPQTKSSLDFSLFHAFSVFPLTVLLYCFLTWILISSEMLLAIIKPDLTIWQHQPFGICAVDIQDSVVFIEIYKTQNKVHPIPNYCVNINRLPSLQPAVCTYFIPSLLLSADVQTFCSEKESLFVTLESFKERETTRPLPVSPCATIQPTKQQIPISMQSLLSITPSTSHTSQSPAKCTSLLLLFLIIWAKLWKQLLVNGDVDMNIYLEKVETNYLFKKLFFSPPTTILNITFNLQL